MPTMFDPHRRVIHFQVGSEGALEAAIKEYNRALHRQTVPFAVAPRARVKLPDGSFLEPGSEVDAAMLGRSEVDGRSALRGLIESGHVISLEMPVSWESLGQSSEIGGGSL